MLNRKIASQYCSNRLDSQYLFSVILYTTNMVEHSIDFCVSKFDNPDFVIGIVNYLVVLVQTNFFK